MRLALVLGLLGCRAADAPGVDLSENAAASFDLCDAGEIAALAGRQQLRLAFAACGKNDLLGGSWSPDGQLLVFLLADGAYVLDGVNKAIVRVPGDVPSALPAWTGPSRLVYPLPPLAGATGARLATADLRADTLDVVAISLYEPRDLVAWEDGRVLLTAVGPDGVRSPYLVGPGGAADRALPWLAGTAEGLSLGGGLVAWSDEGGVNVALAATGERVASFSGALRGVPHPGGGYVVIERPGAPISAFDQQPWGEPANETSAAEAARRERFLQRLPQHVARTVTPPEVDLLDLRCGSAWHVRAWYGAGLSWYPANPDYLSMMLWGVEGRQENRNAALGELLGRLRAVEAGGRDPGLERLSEGWWMGEARPQPSGGVSGSGR